MFLGVFLSLLGVAVVSSNHLLHLRNKCKEGLWVGVVPPTQFGGGFTLAPGQRRPLHVRNHWSGRVWGRTRCGHICMTGDCGGGVLHCNGSTGHPPVTLIEITFDGADGQDYYGVTLVDGYNLQLSMYPTAGTHDTTDHGHYYCGRAGCQTDLNTMCPGDLQIHDPRSHVVGCQSPCLAYDRDEYCCRGAYGTPATCPYFEYARTFKNACTEAQSYAFDGEKTTFTCRGINGGHAQYEIEFC